MYIVFISFNFIFKYSSSVSFCFCSKSSSFTSYSKFDFNDDDQIELAEYYKRISKIGAKAILSNSDPKNTDENDNFFDDLYCDFTIDRIQAPRMISCNGNERKPVNEILVRNF